MVKMGGRFDEFVSFGVLVFLDHVCSPRHAHSQRRPRLQSIRSDSVRNSPRQTPASHVTLKRVESTMPYDRALRRGSAINTRRPIGYVWWTRRLED